MNDVLTFDIINSVLRTKNNLIIFEIKSNITSSKEWST